jgi:putative flippase GtrA
VTETRQQVCRFLVVGSLTVLVDYAAYRAIVSLSSVIDASKAIAFLTGTAFAYVVNRRFTFRSTAPHGSQLVRFLAVYLATLAANVAVNTVALGALHEVRHALTLAFIVATAVSATLNFLGMKFLVFTGATDRP